MKIGFLTSRRIYAKAQLAEAKAQLAENQLSRYKRLHPFVTEALGLLTQDNISTEILPNADSLLNPMESFFSEFGSDKDTRHSYGEIYFNLLMNKKTPRILEVGVGSHNDFPYAGLPPGGALKAFKKKFNDSTIIGVDIDPIAIETIKEEGFLGYEVDQTSEVSLKSVKATLLEHGPFDLIIDDGFHDPHTNIRTLLIFFELLDTHGTYVVEDVHESLIDFWSVIAHVLPGKVEILDLRNQRPETDDNILILLTKK